MKAISKYLFDSTVYKAVSICVFMLIPSFVLCFFPQIVSAAVLLWGALILLRDLLKERNFAKQTGSIFLILFCVSYVITLILFAKDDLISTIHVFCWTIIEFFLLFAIDRKKDTSAGALLDQMYVINGAVSIVALISGVVSLAFFFMKICIVMPDPEGINAFWSMGIVNGRNSGIFNNSIPCANAMFLGVVAALFNMVFPRKKKGYVMGGYIATVVVCFACVLTTLTRTYIYGLYFFCFIAAFAAAWQYGLRKGKASFKRFIAVLCFAVLIGGATVAVAEVSKSLMVKSVENVQMNHILLNAQGFFGTDTEPTNPAETTPDATEPTATDPAMSEEELRNQIFGQLGLMGEVTLEREELDRLPNFLYPRDELWKIALQVIPHSPVFGFTSGNRNSSSIAYGTTEYLVKSHPEGVTTYHNSYFDIAVSAGLLGLGLLLVFLAIQIARALRVLFTKRLTVPRESVRVGYGILIAYLAAHVLITCMFFNALIFNNMSVCLYFWCALGYVSKINDNELAKPGVLSAEGLLGKIMKRK